MNTKNPCIFVSFSVFLYFSILHKKMQVVFCKITDFFLKISGSGDFAGKLLVFFTKSADGCCCARGMIL
ncbi:MAG TPA: hypothetical protein DCG49_06530 [Ruminococcus sp.]|nr:hypothetical protein [Ruminococcus sp.]